MVKKIKISKELLQIILDDTLEDLWKQWEEECPKVYKRLKKILEEGK